MLLTEFDEELFIKTMKEEGEEHINRLYLQLIAEKRLEDLECAAKDYRFRESLYKEYDL